MPRPPTSNVPTYGDFVDAAELGALRATLLEHGGGAACWRGPSAGGGRAACALAQGANASKEQLKELGFDVTKAHFRAAQAHEQLRSLASRSALAARRRAAASPLKARARAIAAARRSGGARRQARKAQLDREAAAEALRAAGMPSRAAGGREGGRWR